MKQLSGKVFIKLMVFDLDGTLADTGADLAFSVNRTLLSMGLPGRPDAEILGFVGDGVRKLLERSLAGGIGSASRRRWPGSRRSTPRTCSTGRSCTPA